MISQSLAIDLTARLFSVAVILQTIETLHMKDLWSDHGTYPWKVHFGLPQWVQNIFDFLLKEKQFGKVLAIQLIGALAIPVLLPAWFCLLVAITLWLSSVRWNGLLNGGSDVMTFTVAVGLLVAEAVPHHSSIGLGYIAIQTVFSYFFAGIYKLFSEKWRKGYALQEIGRYSNYEISSAVKNFLDIKSLSVFASWLIIAFECSFPLALVSPKFCMIYIAASFLFHIVNFYSLGLNRFVFAWLATYPALFWLSTFLQK